MDQHRRHLSRDLIKRRRRNAFGEEIKFQQKGQPTDLGGARQLAKNDKFQFQHLALSLIKRFRGREAGSGLPYQLIASSTRAIGRTKPIATGSTLEIMVQAVNGRAQGVPSDSIVFTVPAAPAAKAETAPSRAPLAAPASNGNGKANDNGTRSVTPVG